MCISHRRLGRNRLGCRLVIIQRRFISLLTWLYTEYYKNNKWTRRSRRRRVCVGGGRDRNRHFSIHCIIIIFFIRRVYYHIRHLLYTSGAARQSSFTRWKFQSSFYTMPSRLPMTIKKFLKSVSLTFYFEILGEEFVFFCLAVAYKLYVLVFRCCTIVFIL